LRKDVLQGLRDRTIDVVIATTIFKEGINIPCMTGDTEIKLLNGTVKSLYELYKNNVGDFWVYSINSNGIIQPAKASKVILSKKDVNIIKITLDNNKYFKCTPEHLIMMRDGTYKQAKELKIKDSLMPLYYKTTTTGYELIHIPGKKRQEFTHRLVGEYFNGKPSKNTTPPNNHKVLNVELCNNKEDVYDIEMVEPNNNFGLSCGVFVHNCLDAFLNCKCQDSDVDSYQLVGRVLRKSAGKTHAIVVDFNDKSQYLHKHGLHRKQLYMQESEFEVIGCKDMDEFKRRIKL
jgi:intein/homing endonuclease